jgi:predicted Zn finger-like uncharacterized protein
MLIQCQSCTSKYRLKLERQPARKMFVRCKNCGTPIYIHPEAAAEETASEPPPVTIPEALAESPVIPPVVLPPEEPPAGPLLVACPNCGARYPAPQEALNRPGIKFKCKQCETVFPPPAALQAPPARASFQPRPAEPPRPVPPESDMPVPNESRLSILFDDLRPGEERTLGKEAGGGPAAAPQTPGAAAPAKPDDAYLEAVSLGNVPATGVPPVSDAQKYRFFLKPDQFHADSSPADADLPALDDEAEPPAGQQPPASKATKEPMTPIDDKDLPPLDDVKPSGPKSAPAGVPAVQLHPDRKGEPPPQQKLQVPDQTGWLKTRTRYIAAASAAAAVLVLGGLWAMWLIQAPDAGQFFAVEIGRAHQISLGSELASRYVANAPSGKRLFVVQGEVENRFPPGREVSWIRLRGTAYADEQQSRVAGAAFGFVGNVLSDQQLASLDPKAIFAQAAYTNGQGNVNFRIPSGKKVPFQLVYMDTSAPVARTVTQVVSYHRDRTAVYVDPGR